MQIFSVVNLFRTAIFWGVFFYWGGILHPLKRHCVFCRCISNYFKIMKISIPLILQKILLKTPRDQNIKKIQLISSKTSKIPQPQKMKFSKRFRDF